MARRGPTCWRSSQCRRRSLKAIIQPSSVQFRGLLPVLRQSTAPVHDVLPVESACNAQDSQPSECESYRPNQAGKHTEAYPIPVPAEGTRSACRCGLHGAHGAGVAVLLSLERLRRPGLAVAARRLASRHRRLARRARLAVMNGKGSGNRGCEQRLGEASFTSHSLTRRWVRECRFAARIVRRRRWRTAAGSLQQRWFHPRTGSRRTGRRRAEPSRAGRASTKRPETTQRTGPRSTESLCASWSRK
jgi:hypothetical protein